MSRIGQCILTIPAEVTVTLQSDRWVTVSGPLGVNRRQLAAGLQVSVTDRQIKVVRSDDSKRFKQLHGTTNALLRGMLVGVKTGYEQKLLISGVGYRAQTVGSTLKLSLGFSQPISYPVPSGVTANVVRGVVIIKGIDKQQVGQVAATIRHFRPAEPYKGKGISYDGEKIRRKAGKTAGK